MADQDKPAFYPRVGNIRPKKQVSPLQQVIQRNMEELSRGPELPQWGDTDLSVPTAANRQMSQRLAEEEQRQRQQAMSNLSPLEKLAAAMQAARVAGSGLVQGIASMPTELMQGPEAAQKQMMEGMYKPTIPQAYDYLEEALDPINKVVEATKLPGVMPEIATIGMIPRELASAQARSLMGRGISKAESAITPFVNRTMEQGGKGAELLGALTQGSRSNVIKSKGGNWFGDSIEREINRLKKNSKAAENLEEMKKVYPPEALAVMSPETRVSVDRAFPHLEKEVALNNWADRNLTNYVKKEMATPEDPVRKLAEQGITHYPVAEDPGYWARHGAYAREDLGGEAVAQSPLAKQWENRTDAMIMRDTAQQHQDMMHLAPGMYSDMDEWIKKLAPETPLYSAKQNRFSGLDLGFDHILDVLREDLATGRIRPEQLNKVSMEQAVRRTYEYDQELAKKMADARAAAREGLPVHKEYPEGYRWVELNKPGAFAQESEAMGHSVRGYEPPKGHADWTEGSGDAGSHGYGHGGWEAIKSGKAKVYSLVDPKGNPHVTVELGQMPYYERKAAEMKRSGASNEEIAAFFENPPMVITQVKGKQNAAPKPEYLPFVQDFVRSSGMPVERDLAHTGLREVGKGKYATDAELAALAARHYPEHPGMTPADVLMHYERMKGMPEFQNDITKKFIEDLEAGNYNPPTEGMKHGGSVHISDNPDTQMMEVEEQKFSWGGAVKRVLSIKDHTERAAKAKELLVRMATSGEEIKPDTQRALLKAQSGPRSLPTVLPRAKPKTKEEIREYAQRTADQMNAAQAGEFLRADPSGPSINAAGKSKSQWEMEQGLTHDIRPLGLPLDPIQVANIEDQLGMLKLGISGDTSISDQVLHRAGPYELAMPSEQQGGPLYGLRIRRKPAAWASNVPVLENLARDVNEFSRAYGDVPVIGQYNSMGPQGTNFAQHFADANLEAIDISKMTPEQVQKTNELIRAGNEKSGPVPDFPGIEDPSGSYLFFSFFPELRKHFNSIMVKPDYTKALGLPDGRVILHGITKPELRDMPVLTSGSAQYQLIPGYDPEKLPLSRHSTYTHDLPRDPEAPITKTPYPVPAEFEFSDAAEYAKPRYKPQEMTRVLQTASPRQIVDQQHIDEIKMYEEMVKELTGKAAGGAITSAALRAMERLKELKAEAALKSDVWKAKQVADEAKYTQDIQPMTPEMMKAEIERMQNPVKKAAGGEITADDLILEERPL